RPDPPGVYTVQIQNDTHIAFLLTHPFRVCRIAVVLREFLQRLGPTDDRVILLLPIRSGASVDGSRSVHACRPVDAWLLRRSSDAARVPVIDKPEPAFSVTIDPGDIPT